MNLLSRYWLDLKLAVRMLFKHPGLAVVAILVLAIGIPIGLLPLHVLSATTQPLPVPDGEDIVIVRNFDRREGGAVEHPLHDFDQWRRELKSYEHLSLSRSDLFNVGVNGGEPAPVRGAEVTASAFSMLRVPPMMGRPLVEADEVTGGPDVVVIGHDFWQSKLDGARGVIGSVIRIGNVPHTVVGVMPQGFLFPLRDNLWVPFRHDVLQYERGEGPTGFIVGRLARGVTIDHARREVELVGQRMATQQPLSHAHLQPQVVPYTRAMLGMDTPEVTATVGVLQVVAFLLLALACGNVGTLVLARVATRTTELAIRTALGASRARLLGQLFIESFVLAVAAAGFGLIVLQAIARVSSGMLPELPYWVDFGVSLKTAAMAIGLAIVSAAIAGVVPALKATSRGVQASIQRASGGGSGVRFGKGYSTLIISEVAVSLVLLAIGSAMLPSVLAKPTAVEVGIPADQYLVASLRIPGMARTTSADDRVRPAVQRVAEAHQALIRRLSAEPGIGPVAIANALPGMEHDIRYIQVEGVPRAPDAPAPAFPISIARVDLGFFEALGQPVLSGRHFNAADLGDDRSAVIVNASFVERVLGGRNPIGRRLRYWEPDSDPGPWSLEIVGVVPSLGMNTLKPEADEGLYHVAAPGELHPVTFGMRVGAAPEQFIPRLRSIVSLIDASALIQSPSALDKVTDANKRLNVLWTYVLGALAAIAVALSAACLYALMSFTVAERTRECGIRSALGAQQWSIASAIGKRAFGQLSVGVVIGALLSSLVLSEIGRYNTTMRTANWPINVALIALLVIVVGMLACMKPTLRAIRIRPMEALRS